LPAENALADADGGRVVRDGGNPPAHRRFNGKIFIANQNLFVGNLRDWCRSNLKVVCLWNAGWA
jgi:hypothetical protein